MFDSRSPVVKITGYIVIGFFVAIVAITFTVSDFMFPKGSDPNIIAIVNGEKIHRHDYLRYRERFAQYLKESNSKQMEEMILDRMIMQRLILQKAVDLGIKISDKRVKSSIKEIPFFKNESGKFENKRLERYLDYSHQSLNDFYKTFEDELVIEELRNLIETGVGVSPEDVQFENIMEKSKLQIKYCFLSNKDLRKRYADRLVVSEKDIDDEMKKNTAEIKDPNTDRERVRRKLDNEKFSNIKRELSTTIDGWAGEKKGFNQSAQYLGGEIAISDEFTIGGQVKKSGKDGKPLYSLGNAPVFGQEILSIEKGATSRAIEGFDGIYVFTPVKKEIDLKAPGEEESKKATEKLTREKSEAVFMALISGLRDSSRITKNLKID